MAACSSEPEPASSADAGTPALDAGRDPRPDAGLERLDGGSASDAGPTADASADAGLPALPEAADPERLTGFVRELSHPDLGGRLTGTASGDAAEAWLRARLVQTGLEIVEQQVTFPFYEVAGPARLAVVDENGTAVEELAYFEEFREIDFSGSGAVTGELVFAGYGVVTEARDDFAGLELSGRIVAVITGVPPGSGLDPKEEGRIDRKVHAAWSRGAVGAVVALAGSAATSAYHAGLAAELAARGPEGVDPALHLEAFPLAFLRFEATERLVGRDAVALAYDPSPFATGRRVALEIHGTTHLQASCRNLLAVHRGTDPALAEEVVLLGAHYDHLGAGADGRVFPGAADNAAGASIVLETATALAASGVRPRRTVVFALFCAEEQGLFGSRHYVEQEPLFPLAATALMVAVDFIGEGDPMLTNPDDNPLFQLFFGDADQHPELPIDPVDYHGGCASDDCPFLWAGRPAYRFLANGVHHHLPSDTFETLRLPVVVRIADVCIEGIAKSAY